MAKQLEKGPLAMSEGDALQRITPVGLIIGGVLTLAANAISLTFLRAVDPNSLPWNLTAYSDNETLGQLGALTRATGIWAMVVGFTNVHHFIRVGAGAAWARVGFYGLVIGGSGLTVAEGLALGSVDAAVGWAAAPADLTWGTATTLLLASRSIYDLSVIAFWSALIVVGFAWTRTNVYPSWAAWSLLGFGVATTAMGLVHLFVSATTTLELALVIPVGLTSAWAIVVGIWLTRKAWSTSSEEAHAAR